ncbi:MAG: AlpA family phage regulatory protein [Candidatus Cloacimonetes bacterium]|nr:AlpA family phage regulatory protein [Candidatus Cloacimonadota bacterium]
MIQAVLKRAEVVALVGLGYTTIWRLEKKGEFPARRKLSIGRVGWLHSEVQGWLDSRVSLLATA